MGVQNLGCYFGNMQHILKVSVGEFNSSFGDEFDRRVVPHQNGRKFSFIQIRIDFF
jgi:hypothetical protein